MPGVIQVVERGGQYQIVIGTHAKDVYAELAQLLNPDSSAGETAEVKQSLMNRVIATMSAVFAPFVYVLAAAGLLQGCLIIGSQLSPTFNTTGFYQVMNFISWTPFVFLPAFIALTASHHFKCNTYVAVTCALALVSPSWGEMAARIANGESITFLLIPLTQTTYSSTVLPPLFLVLILSYLERFLDDKLPEAVKALATPFLCIAVMVPFTILLIGPVTEYVSAAIGAGYNAMYIAAPALAAAVIGGVWEVLVIFGVHWGIIPLVMANFEAQEAVHSCVYILSNSGCSNDVLRFTELRICRTARTFDDSELDKSVRSVVVSGDACGMSCSLCRNVYSCVPCWF